MRREKYALECLELIDYRKNHISSEQRGSVNLDDHTAYLRDIRKDKSLYPFKNVMTGEQLIQLLEKYGLDEKASKVRGVIKKGSNTYAPTGMLSPTDPVIEPKYFIRVIQKSTGEIMDRRDGEYGDDQNMGLHDLVSQMSMSRVTSTQNITVNGYTYQTQIDIGFCPFCPYHAECHKILNNHVRLHFWMPMFCRVPCCFYCTFNIKTMIPHAIQAHLDLYQKSKIPGKLFLVTRVFNSGLITSSNQLIWGFPSGTGSTADWLLNLRAVTPVFSILDGLQTNCTQC